MGVDTLAASAGLELVVESRHAPTFRWTPDPEAAAAPPSPLVAWLGRLFRPVVTLHSAFGTVRKAPYGEPGGTTWPALAVVLVLAVLAVVALAVVGVVSLVRR